MKYRFTLFVILFSFFYSCSSSFISFRPHQDNFKKSIISLEKYQELLAKGEYGHATILLRKLKDKLTDYPEEEIKLLSSVREVFEKSSLDNNINSMKVSYSILDIYNKLEKKDRSNYHQQLFKFYSLQGFILPALEQARIIENDKIISARIRGEAKKFIENHTPTKLINWNDRIKATVTVIVDLGSTNMYGIGLPKKMLGSGFFIDHSGYIITNYHVISPKVDPEYEGYSKVYVKLSSNSKEYPARVVGWDSQRDLALIKIAVESDYVLSLSDSLDKLAIGDPVFAIGSPVGLERTLTAGHLSAINRPILPLSDVMQIDVPVNHGNSGGPLLNKEGEIIGIVFAGAGGNYQGLNFAIPVTTLKEILPRLYKGNKISNSWLGLVLDEFKAENRVVIRYIFPNTPASRSKLEIDDEVIGINGLPVHDVSDARMRVTDLPKGSLLAITFKRKDKEKKIILPVEQRLEEPLEWVIHHDGSRALFRLFFGADIDLINETGEYIVQHVIPSSIADENRLGKGDLLRIYRWVISPDKSQVGVLLKIEGKNNNYFVNNQLFFTNIANNGLIL